MKLNYFLRIVVLISFFGNAQAPAIEWQKSFGSTNVDIPYSLCKTTDGGYIVAGYSSTNNGDVSGNNENEDFWIVKITSTGSLQWQKSLGGITGYEYASSIIQTTDGGYIVAGYSNSNNGDVSGNHGSYDFWIVKLTSTGSIQWQKSLGGTYVDNAYSIIQTTDGGYIIAGYSDSNDGDVTGNHGHRDFWIVKLTLIGSIEWQKSLGGTGYEGANSIIQTTDGGYIVAGISNSNDGDVIGNHGGDDSWIVKLTSTGSIEWQKSLGGTGSDNTYSIIQTTDGGYIIAGYSNSNNGDVSGNHGSYDSWIVKLTSTGSIEWQKSLGGSFVDNSYSIIKTTEGGYIVAGYTQSNDVDVNGNHGLEDIWIVKLSSIGNIQWQKSLGGTNREYATSIVQTIEGGYIIAGGSDSNNGDVTVNHGITDYWIVKLAPENLSNDSFIENTTISIFPNPAKENLTLKLNYFTPSQEITITDIQGKIIHNQKLESLSTTINTSSFEKGIYFLNLIDGSQKTTKKFIVE